MPFVGWVISCKPDTLMVLIAANRDQTTTWMHWLKLGAQLGSMHSDKLFIKDYKETK